MGMQEERVARIRGSLEQALTPLQIEIFDDSQAHAGHDPEARGAGHFFITVISDRFIGLLPLARHRLVYAAVEDLMESDIHALSIKTLTPQEAAQS